VIDPAVSLAVRLALEHTALSHGRLLFGGDVVAGPSAETEQDRDAAWLTALQGAFYNAIYRPGITSDGAAGAVRHGATDVSEPAFVDALKAIVDWRGQDTGWRLEEADSAGPIISRNGLRLSVRDGDLLAATPAAVPGDAVTLLLRGGFTRASPGFFLAASPRPMVLGSGDKVVRWYFNIRHDGAAALLDAVRRHAVSDDLPFQVKVLSNPVTYIRTDAAVFYTRRSDQCAAAAIAGLIHRSVAPYLSDATPMFARRMAPGVGLAEDPPGEDSFGMWWSRHLARAVLHSLPVTGAMTARTAAVLDQLAIGGPNLAAPHLTGPAETEYQQLPVLPARRHRAIPPVRPDAALEAIIQALVGDALWHDGRATWFSRSSRPSRKTARTLGIDVYGGLAGVAWFLGEAAAATGDKAALAASRGAMEQAFSLAETHWDEQSPGLYTGLAGLCVVASRLGKRLGQPSWGERAGILVTRALAPGGQFHRDEGERDLLSGSAGILVALAIPELGGAAANSQWRGIADRLTERVMASLEDNAPVGKRSRKAGLLGYSHGATGTALGLCAAGVALRHPGAIEAARALLRYEDGHYVTTARNWPDFRSPRRTFQSAWCHGAPGVLLGRHILRRRLGLDLAEDGAAIAAARQGLRERLRRTAETPAGDWTLCHGVLGLSETFALTATDDADRQTARDVLMAGIEMHGRSAGGVWPMRDGAREPVMMCGLPGIGMAILRMLRPETPSPLTLGFDDAPPFPAPVVPAV
jgi:hypothetical protein